MALSKYDKIKSGTINLTDVIDYYLGSYELREYEITNVQFPYHRDGATVVTVIGRKNTIRSGYFGQKLEFVWKIQIFPPGIRYADDPEGATREIFKKVVVGEYPVERLWYFTLVSCIYGPDEDGKFHKEGLPRAHWVDDRDLS